MYPGAGYDRLEHSLGVLEAAQRILSALERNAEVQRAYAQGPDRAVPTPSERDRVATRLAALLHDTGHAAFSHASEHAIPTQFPDDFEAATDVLRSEFEGTTTVHPAEQMAVLFVLSRPFQGILNHPRFEVRANKELLPEAIAARILGSRSYLSATYLSGVVSGPLDADMIDYLARDSHHAGLPLGLDITRLVSKLEVVEVTTQNALGPELQGRAEENGGRFYELGLSRAGLGAFEQLIMARVTLYERLYYHHKIRAAEGMARNVIEGLGKRGQTVTLEELYSALGDETLTQVWGGAVECQGIKAGDSATRALATQIRNRDLFHRAFVFAARFIAGLDGLPKVEADETKSVLWSSVTGELEDFEGSRAVAGAIFLRSNSLSNALSEFQSLAGTFTELDIVVDLAKHSRVAKSTEILIASEAGHVSTPDLFFNAERWANAYVTRKQSGYVFAPMRLRRLVSLAARIEFYERYGIAMNSGADVAGKTHGLIDAAVWEKVHAAGLCSAECLAMLQQGRPRLIQMRAEHLQIPDELLLEDPELKRRLAGSFRDTLPRGLPASVHTSVIEAIGGMVRALQSIEMQGLFVHSDRPREKRDLQQALRLCLSSASTQVIEAAEVGGGETDLLLSGSIVLENKVLGKTDMPTEALTAASWQARRYSVAVCQRVRFICAAYHPTSEGNLLRLSERVLVRQGQGGSGDSAEVLFLVPYGHGIPSQAG